ncbi:MAG: helix-turn-helix domain-containing protein, partial [Candidatus Competibacteraceae bacterium]|nr:helix-turn-helix domain-containing protein [Candidatus Competibacteraceae bacterium]
MIDPPRYLTTKEVADLLRVKERKVYELAAAGDIPHRRITGKLLFPASEIQAWIEGGDSETAAERPPVLTGSHDPLLDWAVRESGSSLATLWNGSLRGLDVFASGDAAASGLHLPEPDGWNLRSVAAHGLTHCVLVSWAVRSRGLLLAQDQLGSIRGFTDLRGKRIVLRQPGAGAAAL